jgi:tight adherence protein B
MNAFAVSLVSGSLVFIGIFLTFDYWYDRVWGSLKSECESLEAVYRDLFITKTQQQIIRQQVMISSIAALFFFVVMWPQIMISIPVSIGVFALMWKAPRFYFVNIVKPGRVAQFSVQMVDALTLMSNGLKAGLNVAQTIQIVVDEMPNPIKQEFGLVLSENRVGKSLEEAFDNLAKRLGSEDVLMFVTSVNILSETGGNIAETFQNITKTIRERLKLQSKITAMTAQAMTSAVIVGCLPFAMAVMLYFTDPETMTPLFTTPAGWLILLLVLVFEGIGFYVIMKMVKIKV